MIYQDDILKELIAQGKISEGDAEEARMNLRYEKILAQHPYDIYQGNDGKWHTSVPDATKPEKRRRIKKKRKEDLLEYLADFYEKNNTICTPGTATLRILYPLWLEHKRNTENAPGNISRIETTWKKYYENSEIVDILIDKMSVSMLEEWVVQTIHGMTIKQYEKFSVILNQVLEWAEGDEIIERNPFHKVKLRIKDRKRKLLTYPKKKKSEDVVYTAEEMKKVIGMAFHDLEHHVKQYELAPLALIFHFATGVRIGELVVLKYKDIEDNMLFVRRMLRRDERRVVEFTKGEDTEGREIPLSRVALDCIAYAKRRAEELGVDTEYIFCIDGTPNSYYRSVSEAHIKYSEKIGKRKTSHTARRQYLSVLDKDGDLDLDTLRRLAGHADASTTQNSYLFSTDDEQKKRQRVRDTVDTSIFNGFDGFLKIGENQPEFPEFPRN